MNQKQKHPVLLVDDEPEILFSLQGLLRREFELHTAESGREALQLLEQHPIHVLMTDQRMPEMSGTELISRVKTLYPDIIRIVFTGYADIKAVIEAINTGSPYRYLTKPWDPDELVTVLHEATSWYEELAGRKQLLHELHEHLAHGQALMQKLPEEKGNLPENLIAELQHFAEQSKQLVEQLDKVIAADLTQSCQE